jgi:hypothetical protein
MSRYLPRPQLRRFALLAIAAACSLFACSTPASAVTIETDTILDGATADGPIEIIRGANPTPTVVTVLDPADIDTDIVVLDDSTLTIVGGQLQSFRAQAISQVTVVGGQITAASTATDSSQVAIVGGEMLDFYRAQGASQTTITGGLLWGVQASDAAFVQIVGGQFTDLLPAVQNSLEVSGGGTILIHGTGFNYPAGAIPDASGLLTGTLASGEPIALRFNITQGGSIQLAVAEPSSIALVGLGIVAAAYCQRRRRIM